MARPNPAEAQPRDGAGDLWWPACAAIAIVTCLMALGAAVCASLPSSTIARGPSLVLLTAAGIGAVLAARTLHGILRVGRRQRSAACVPAWIMIHAMTGFCLAAGSLAAVLTTLPI
jgi:hypothetical protein